jgi:hypothetical protein
MPGTVETFTEEFLREPPDLPLGAIISISDLVTLPKQMPVGPYSLALGIVGERSTEPVVRLGIKGRTEDGWYSLSSLVISE